MNHFLLRVTKKEFQKEIIKTLMMSIKHKINYKKIKNEKQTKY